MSEKKKKRKKVAPKRKLSGSEKFLLGFLFTVLVGAVVYFKVWVPQNQMLTDLTQREAEYQQKIDHNNAMLRKAPLVDKEYEELYQRQNMIAANYISKLDQPALIYKLNELLTRENVAFPNYSFVKTATQKIGEFDVKYMTASFPFDGTYEGVLKTLNAVSDNPQKILVDRIDLKKDENTGALSGNLNLKFYSMDGIVQPRTVSMDEEEKSETPAEESGSASTETSSSGEGTAVADGSKTDAGKTEPAKTEAGTTEAKPSAPGLPTVDAPKVTKEKVPFTPFPGYKTAEDAQKEKEKEKEELKPFIEATIMNFDKGHYYFLPSHDLIKGKVLFSKKAKSGKSLRLEYDMVAIEEMNRAYIDVSKNQVQLSYPPDALGVWVYSYDYLPVTIGMELEGQLGEKIEVPFTEGLGWTGWKYLSVAPPAEIASYPLKLEKLFVEMPKGRDGNGVFLLDDLETVYERNIDEDGTDLSVKPYISYVVQFGDTSKVISTKIYGSPKYAKEILKLNELKTDEDLEPGRVLVLKRR